MLPEYELVLASSSPTTDMTAFLGLLGTVVTSIFSNVGEIADIIVSTPLLAFPCSR